jgi:Protein of unknwon function (DUF3310)
MGSLRCPECSGVLGIGGWHAMTCQRRLTEESFMLQEDDQINRPEHYNYGKTETIDYIMQVATLYPGHQAVLVGNVIKYISRAPMKGDKEKDLKKAQWYLNKLIESL